jgi:uncharacterized BrkB/YihY/UPF0761 family membrane protein
MSILRAPLFIVCFFLFVTHQVLQKIFHVKLLWVDSYIDNLLAMPIILSLWQVEKIWLYRKGPANKISALEIFVATLYISLISEVIFPLFSKDFKEDSVDVIVYFIGSGLFYGVNNKTKKHYD